MVPAGLPRCSCKWRANSRSSGGSDDDASGISFHTGSDTPSVVSAAAHVPRALCAPKNVSRGSRSRIREYRLTNALTPASVRCALISIFLARQCSTKRRTHIRYSAIVPSVRQRFSRHARGLDIDRSILALSTYVGHVKVTDTYWYVTATPELMAIAAQRFTRYMGGVS